MTSSYEQTQAFLNLQDSFPDGDFMIEFYRLDLDEQVVLLKEFTLRHPSDSRAWKLLGLCYFWMLNDDFLEDAVQCLLRCLELGITGYPDAIQEAIASCYLLKGDRKTAVRWYSKSQRFNIGFVERTYGSLEHFAIAQRDGNKGARFRSFTSGEYPISQLHLETNPYLISGSQSEPPSSNEMSSNRNRRFFAWLRR